MTKNKMWHISAFVCILAAILVSACTGTSTEKAIDPIAGSWTYKSVYNGTAVVATLVFDSDGYFNGYLSGILSISGHWKKVNGTTYEIYYDDSMLTYIMSNDKTQIWDNNVPREIFKKQ